jgi:hypothetical protein
MTELTLPSATLSRWATLDPVEVITQLDEGLSNLPQGTILEILISAIDETITCRDQLEILTSTLCTYVDNKQLWRSRFNSNADFVASIPELGNVLDSATRTGVTSRKLKVELERIWTRPLKDMFPNMIQTRSFHVLLAMRELSKVASYENALDLVRNARRNRLQQAASLDKSNPTAGRSTRWLKSPFISRNDILTAKSAALGGHGALLSIAGPILITASSAASSSLTGQVATTAQTLDEMEIDEVQITFLRPLLKHI